MLAGKKTDKKNFVRQKFSAVVRRYDLINTVTSFGIDHLWRQAAAKELSHYKGPILDLCAGTLPLSLELVRQEPRPIMAVDFCYEMLAYGQGRLEGRRERPLIHSICGDGEQIPLKEACVWGVTVAFGVRNLSRPEKGLSEMYRVLKPGGKLVVLEFSRPKGPFRAIYRFYLSRILPKVAGIISGDEEAYRYLASSIWSFPEPTRFAFMMEEAGFKEISYRPLTLGIVTIYTGLK
ncbi:ubiquinone/menaquinone biosynthesis methyltransferase [Thermosulfuriphilus sp.]